MTLTLRPYQERAKQEARKLIASRVKRILVVSPTGSGKTILFASIVLSAVERASNVLILAHRRELLSQAFIKFVRAGLDPSLIGVVLAGVEAGPAKPILGPIEDASDEMIWKCLARRRPNAPVQVASIDSIRNRTKPPANLIIIDEAHRVLSAGYMKLADEYPDAVFVGLTATPLRADSRPLGNFFAAMVIVATYRDLVAEGFLIEPRVFTVPAEELPDLAQVRLKGGDFDPEQLGQACNQKGLVGSITEHWKRHGNNAPTICFAVNVQHSMNIAQQFNEAGIPAAHVDGAMATHDRDAALKSLRTGAIKVLVNVDVGTEGLDIPSIKTVILARPTQSLRVYLQQVGRGSRPDKSGIPFTVLDHAGAVICHGLPQCVEFLPEILHFTKNKSGLKAAPARSCPSCWAVVPASSKVCPDCGFEFVNAPREAIEEHEGELVEVVAPTVADLTATWRKLTEECVEHGYAPGWCFIRWGEMFPGQKPPAGCTPPSAEACSKKRSERVELLDGYVAKAIESGYSMKWVRNAFKARDGSFPSNEMLQRSKSLESVRLWLSGLGVVFGLRAPVEKPQASVTEPQAERVQVERVALESVPANLVEYEVA